MSEKKLYRSPNSLLGGVCKGVAEYFNVDPIIVQIITVLATLATGGLVGVAYIALWVVLPEAPLRNTPVDVAPYSVQTQSYDQGKESTPSQSTPHSSAPTSPVTPDHSAEISRGALWLGFILLFIGITASLSFFVTRVEWWQFWPLFFVIAGIGSMVVPGKKGHRMDRFINGLTSFSFGVAALPFSLGLLALSSITTIFANLWPLLIIMCGLYVLGEAMKAPLIKLLGGLCFAAFCVIGLIWFATPGPIESIIVTLPTGKTFSYGLVDWARWA